MIFDFFSKQSKHTHTHTRQEGRGFFSHIHNNFEARTSVSKKINAVLVALINIYFDSIFFKIFDLLDSIRYFFFFCFRGVNSYLMTSSIKQRCEIRISHLFTCSSWDRWYFSIDSFQFFEFYELNPWEIMMSRRIVSG